MKHNFLRKVSSWLCVATALFGCLNLSGGVAHAQTGTTAAFKPDLADTAWMLVATALVMLMTPALGLFYGGLVHRKNVMNVIMQSFIALSVVTLLWVIIGYSLSFAPGNAFIGGFSYLGLMNTEPSKQLVLNGSAFTIPSRLFMVYQMMFAIITPALISGAIVERMKFWGYVLFITLWSLFIYSPLAHSLWGEGGYLFKMGALDFAGGMVVHLSSGVAALVMAIMLGKRKKASKPHNLPMTLLGGALLWFGWFGFNAGSAGASGDIAVNAYIVTHIAAGTAALAWMLLDNITNGKPTALGFVSGIIVGLVAITPCAGYVAPLSAIPIGAIAAVVAFYTCQLKTKFGYDDSLDVFAVHGAGGFWGTAALGLFASSSINSAVPNGLLISGDPTLLGRQIVALAYVLLFCAIGTFLIGTVVRAITGLRVNEYDEAEGLDPVEHGENGYVTEDEPEAGSAPMVAPPHGPSALPAPQTAWTAEASTPRLETATRP